MPRFHHQWYPDVVYLEEEWKFSSSIIDQFISAGYPIQYREPIGRIDAILKRGTTWYGGGDPRGDDAAAGY